SLAFTPDGKKVACGWSMGSILVWDVATGKVSQTLTGRVLVGRSATFTERCYYSGSMAMSRDGKTIALGTVGDTVQLWDLATGKDALAITVPDSMDVASASFSHDGRKIFTLDRNEDRQNWSVRHWDVATGNQNLRWTLPRESSPRYLKPRDKWAIALSQDGK